MRGVAERERSIGEHSAESSGPVSESASLVGKTTRIGVPTHELSLIGATIRDARSLLAPGAGRQLVLLSEVEIGIGRPDVLLLAVSLRGVRARAQSGLRINNLTEARVLAALHDGSLPGLSSSHARAVIRRLEGVGWIQQGVVRDVPQLVNDSLLIEAKVRDWRGGLVQLARTRWASHRSALLLGSAPGASVPGAPFEQNGLGLLADSGQSLSWVKEAPGRPLSWMADVWLTELLIRQFAGSSDPSQTFFVDHDFESLGVSANLAPVRGT